MPYKTDMILKDFAPRGIGKDIIIRTFVGRVLQKGQFLEELGVWPINNIFVAKLLRPRRDIETRDRTARLFWGTSACCSRETGATAIASRCDSRRIRVSTYRNPCNHTRYSYPKPPETIIIEDAVLQKFENKMITEERLRLHRDSQICDATATRIHEAPTIF